MQTFAYEAPSTLKQALTILKEHHKRKRRAQLLAGGTDLLVQMRGADREPRTLVDVKRIAEANRIDYSPKKTFIGAAVPGVVLIAEKKLAARHPGLVDAIDLIGSMQVLGRATLGGNVCNASPAGDTIPALIANGAECVIASPRGKRDMPVEKFLVGVGKNALKKDEILLGFRFDKPAPRTADAYLRFTPRTEMDIAVVGAGVCVTLDRSGVCTAARVAIGAVAPTAILVPAAADALVGTRLEEAALRAAGDAAVAAARPISDKRGTADFRRRIVAVLVRRATAIAAERARTKGAAKAKGK
jgi:carbon-monoxide dehydrogenase medium subunit